MTYKKFQLRSKISVNLAACPASVFCQTLRLASFRFFTLYLSFIRAANARSVPARIPLHPPPIAAHLLRPTLSVYGLFPSFGGFVQICKTQRAHKFQCLVCAYLHRNYVFGQHGLAALHNTQIYYTHSEKRERERERESLWLCRKLTHIVFTSILQL